MIHKALLAFGDAPFGRLIIGAGNHNRDLQMAPCNIGKLVTSHLLNVCGPPLSDIHDPTIPNSRGRVRDKYGIDKEERKAFYVPSDAGGRSAVDNILKLSQRGQRHTWGTAPFMDFGGLFCDRLLCGSPPKRTAVFQPPILSEFNASSSFALRCDILGSSIENVLRHFPHIDSCDILVVCPTKGIPIGGMYLSTLRNVEKHGLVDDSNLHLLHGINNSLVRILTTPDGPKESDSNNVSYDLTVGLATSVLTIGIGGLGAEGGIPLRAPMSRTVSSAMMEYIVPKAAYACGYWCSNPPKASAFLSKDIVLNNNIYNGISNSASNTNNSNSSTLETSNRIPSTLRFTLAKGIFAELSKTAFLSDPFDSSAHHLSTVSLLRASGAQRMAWASNGMFGAMLSTHDEAIIRAYEKGIGVKEPFLGVGRTRLLAEGIIERIIKGGKST